MLLRQMLVTGIASSKLSRMFRKGRAAGWQHPSPHPPSPFLKDAMPTKASFTDVALCGAKC